MDRKLADLTVLDRDIFTVEAEEVLATNVSATMVGGEVVYGEL
ncbi:MAG: amidohydrolase family protein [Caldilineaceae bacterium]